MNPMPLAVVAAIVSVTVMTAWAFWCRADCDATLFNAAVGAAGLCIALAVALMGAFALALGNGVSRAAEFAIELGMLHGVYGAGPALVGGYVGAAAARGLSLLLVPEGRVRRPHESLAAMSRRTGVRFRGWRVLLAVVTVTALGAVGGGGIAYATHRPVPDTGRRRIMTHRPVSAFEHGASQGGPVGLAVGALIVIGRLVVFRRAVLTR